MVKPLYLFGVETEVQNLVGIKEWGIYFELFNFAFLFQMIHEPGIHSYNARTIAREPDRLGYYFPRIMGVKMVLGLVFMLAVIGSFFVFGFKPILLPLLIFVAVNQFLSTLFMYLRTNISSIGKYRTDSFMSALDKVLMVIIVGALVYAPSLRADFQVIWMAYGQFAGLLIACLVAIGIIVKHLHKFDLRFSWKYLIQLLKESYPYALVLLFMIFYTRVDGVMLGRMLDDGGYQVGIYGACYRILDAINMIGYLFAALLLPMFSSQISKLNVINGLVGIGLRSLSVIAFIVATTIFIYSKEILYSLYDGATMEMVTVLRYLVGSFIMISIAYIFGTLLVAKGSLKKLNILYFMGIWLNVMLNLFLIPSLMAEGAAIATLCTQAIILLGQVYLCRIEVGISISWGVLARILLFGLFCAIISWSIYHFLFLHFLLKIALGIMISLCLALWIRLIDVKELLSLVKR